MTALGFILMAWLILACLAGFIVGGCLFIWGSDAEKPPTITHRRRQPRDGSGQV